MLGVAMVIAHPGLQKSSYAPVYYTGLLKRFSQLRVRYGVE